MDVEEETILALTSYYGNGDSFVIKGKQIKVDSIRIKVCNFNMTLPLKKVCDHREVLNNEEISVMEHDGYIVVNKRW